MAETKGKKLRLLIHQKFVQKLPFATWVRSGRRPDARRRVATGLSRLAALRVRCPPGTTVNCNSTSTRRHRESRRGTDAEQLHGQCQPERSDPGHERQFDQPRQQRQHNRQLQAQGFSPRRRQRPKGGGQYGAMATIRSTSTTTAGVTIFSAGGSSHNIRALSASSEAINPYGSQATSVPRIMA